MLFPPLCFVDFSNGATVLDHDDEKQEEQEEEEEEVEVSFFLWDWIKGIFNV